MELSLKDLIARMDAIEEADAPENNYDTSGEEDDRAELKVGDYQTLHFDMCPAATELYKDIEDKVDDMDLAERTAKLQDVLYYLEKNPNRDHVPEDARIAEIVADQIMSMAAMMGLEDEHDYIQGHVDAIKDKVDEN